MKVIFKDDAYNNVKNRAWYPPACEDKDEHIDFLFEGCREMDIVFCKDCKWWNGETKGCKRNPSVEAWYKTDFCKYGERR